MVRKTTHRDLDVWRRARLLVKEVYDVSATFPKNEVYALAQQMQRAAISIPSNIAEGYARNTTKDYMRFISIALGSLAELETQLLLCCDLQYTVEKEITPLFEEITALEKMLRATYNTLNKKLETTS